MVLQPATRSLSPQRSSTASFSQQRSQLPPPPGVHSSSVSLGFGARGSFVQLAVADSGCGVDETVIENLFSPFFSSRQAGNGSGLGLNIVHRIVESHNGGIEVSSDTGDGTTFYIYLPVVAEPVPV